MSGSEVLIYAYGAVCLSMIMFNIIYNIVLRKKEPETTMKAQKIKEALLKEYSADSDTGTTGWETSRVQAFLKEEDLELGKSEDLLTFSEAVSLLAEEGLEEAAEGMIRGLQPLFPALSEDYLKKTRCRLLILRCSLKNSGAGQSTTARFWKVF